MKNKSFTLIELLVVIVIIGILSSVIIISVSDAIDKANFAKAQAFSSTVKNELFSDLISEWTFDEDSGTTAKDTAGNNDGTLVGANGLPQLQSKEDCVYGACYSFDGTDDYIDFGNLGVISSNFTYAAWFKSLSSKSYNMILNVDGSVNGNPQLRLSGEKVQFKLYNSYNLNSSKKYNDNIWHFTCGGVNIDGDLFLYVDGASQGTLVIETSLNWNGNTKIGYYTPYDTFFDGLIDEVRIYDIALSSAQIKQEYIAGLNSLLANNNISKEEYNERVEEMSSK